MAIEGLAALGGLIIASVLTSNDDLLNQLIEYTGDADKGFALFTQITTDEKFRNVFLEKLEAQKLAAGGSECARPGDVRKPEPMITPMPDTWEPLPGFAPSEIEKKPHVTPVPNDDDDGVACGGIPIHEPTFEDFILTNEKAQKDLATGKPLSDADKARAQNAGDALRLRTELALREKGILTKEGKLTENAVKESMKIKEGRLLDNPAVIKELTKDGSNLSDWEKRSTKHIIGSNDQNIQVHFYQNKITGKIDYVTKDFKTQTPILP